MRGTAEIIGGPVGRHARLGAARWWTPLRVLLALTLLTLTLGWAQKAPCRDTTRWVHSYQYTHLCYSDVSALYFSEHLVDAKTPYVDYPVEYPVLIGGLMGMAAVVVHGADTAARPARFYDVTALALAIAALAVVVTTSLLAGRRRLWDAAMVALAPTLLLHFTTNWDLAAVACTGLGMLLWARHRPAWAGVLLGLGVATKLYPLLFLVPLLLLCLRAGRMRAWRRTAVATVGTAVAVYAPFYLTASYFTGGDKPVAVAGSPLSRLGSDGLGALAPHVAGGTNAVLRFFSMNKTRPADFDSLWYALHHAWSSAPDTGTLLSVAVAVVLVLLLAGIGWLALRAPRRPRLPQLLFLSLVAFLLANKVFSPQYTLWLLPLAVLARPSWRALLAWQATEVLVLFTRFYFFVSLDKAGTGMGVDWFIAAVLLRDLALVGYAALVVRDILHPERDVVRAGGVDDPAGGVLADAPDHPSTRGTAVRVGATTVSVPE